MVYFQVPLLPSVTKRSPPCSICAAVVDWQQRGWCCNVKREIDITKISLSRAEIKRLRWIEMNEPVQEEHIERDPLSLRLYERGLIERCYSSQFPYMPPYGVIEIPHNAFRLNDAGRQYLNRRKEIDSEIRFTRTIAIYGAITGTAAIIAEIVLHFL